MSSKWALLLVALLVGCDRKEPPPSDTVCHNVVVLHVAQKDSSNTTLMEVTDSTKIRMSREGYFGAVGDQFTFCEKP